MNGYELSKKWFVWCRNNRDKNNPALSALYFWIIEKCNTLGWIDSFGLPTDEAMHILAIGSYNTYKKNLFLLEEIGFIKIIEHSKNQYTSNVIALSNFDKASSKQVKSTEEAFDKAPSKQIEYNKTLETNKNSKTVKTDTKAKYTPPSYEDFENYALEKDEKVDLKIDLVKLKLKYQSWKENDWHNGHGRKIKNWKTTLNNTLPYLKQEENEKSTSNQKGISSRKQDFIDALSKW